MGLEVMEVPTSSKADDVADDDERWTAEMRVLDTVGERGHTAPYDALLRGCAAFDGYGGGIGGEAPCGKVGDEIWKLAEAHVDDEGGGRVNGAQVEARAIADMASEKADGMRDAAVRKRDAQLCANTRGGRDARHSADLDALLLEKLGLLTAAAKHKRVATLEANDGLPNGCKRR